MKILVCVASKHHATEEIGARVRQVLARDLGGAVVELRAPDDVTSVEAYDAVVVGSAVYLGRWLPRARRFVERHAADLSARPVWLFSSGPVARQPAPDRPPADVAALRPAVSARDHHVFAGRLERRVLSRWERAVVHALKVPDGDWRDWPAIEAWAGTIAQDLRAVTPAG